MTFSSTVTHDSISVPGVKFTVHRMGFGRRTDLDFATLTHRQRLRELEADHPPRSDKEKDLTEQLAIAWKKAQAVPAAEHDAVVQADVEPLKAELEGCVPQDVKKKRAVLNEEYLHVESRIQAAWVRAGLIGIEGGDLDGMTADQLLDFGPQEVALEIYGALISDGRLRSDEQKNSLPAITSGEAVAGEKTSTTADVAEVQPVVGT